MSLRSVAHACARTGMKVASGLGGLERLRRRKGIGRILLYHRIRDQNDDFIPDALGLYVTPGHFEEQLLWLLKHYRVLGLNEFIAASTRGEDRIVTITFDDGFGDNARIAAPILERHGIPAAFFLATDGVGNRRYLWLHRWFWWRRRVGPAADRVVRQATDGRWESAKALETSLRGTVYGEERESLLERILRETGLCPPSPGESRLYLDENEVVSLHRAGHVIGSHGTTHSSFGSLSPSDALAEIRGAHERIEALTGRPPAFFSYPYGQARDTSPVVGPELARLGYCSCLMATPGVARADHAPWAWPRLDVFNDDPLPFSWAIEGFPAFVWMRPWKLMARMPG